MWLGSRPSALKPSGPRAWGAPSQYSPLDPLCDLALTASCSFIWQFVSSFVDFKFQAQWVIPAVTTAELFRLWRVDRASVVVRQEWCGAAVSVGKGWVGGQGWTARAGRVGWFGGWEGRSILNVSTSQAYNVGNPAVGGGAFAQHRGFPKSGCHTTSF